MKPSERQLHILQMARAQGRVNVVALARQLFIADEAVPRDMVSPAVTDVPCAAQPVMNGGESAR